MKAVDDVDPIRFADPECTDAHAVPVWRANPDGADADPVGCIHVGADPALLQHKSRVDVGARVRDGNIYT